MSFLKFECNSIGTYIFLYRTFHNLKNGFVSHTATTSTGPDIPYILDRM